MSERAREVRVPNSGCRSRGLGLRLPMSGFRI